MRPRWYSYPGSGAGSHRHARFLAWRTPLAWWGYSKRCWSRAKMSRLRCAFFHTFLRREVRGSGNRLWFEPAHFSHEFIRTHPLGKPIADRHDTDVGRVILLSNGLQTGFHLLRIAIDIGAAKFGDIGQFLGTIAVGQGSVDGRHAAPLPQGGFQFGQVTTGGQAPSLCLGLST